MKVVLAVPTIEARGDAWRAAGEAFQRHSSVPLTVVPSWRQGGWAAGLNEVVELHPEADVLICASDDMEPQDDNWLPPILKYLDEGFYPAPKMLNHDPTRGYWEYPGTWEKDPVDGTPSKMSTFCCLKGDWLPHVFPLPLHPVNGFHYYADDEIAKRVKKLGVKCVAVPSSVIVHRMSEVGRGAGFDEQTRMTLDRELFRSLR